MRLYRFARALRAAHQLGALRRYPGKVLRWAWALSSLPAGHVVIIVGPSSAPTICHLDTRRAHAAAMN